MYAKGKANNMPSILSKIPPCPGINFPVSLIFDFLLKIETIISQFDLQKKLQK